MEDNTVVILDNPGEKIIFYNLFGDLIQEIKIDRNINIDNISNIDNDHLALFTGYSDKNSCISILNIRSHEIKKLLFNIPHYAQNSQSELDQTFTKYKESVLFKSLFDYNVFQITPDSIIPQYQFDFKKYNISFKSFDGKIETVIAYIRRDDYISEPDCLLENDEYIYCNFFKGGKFYELYYNKQQQRPYLFNAETLPEEFASIYSNPKYAKNNYFIFTIADEDHLHTLLKLHQASTNHIKLIYTPLVSQENLEIQQSTFCALEPINMRKLHYIIILIICLSGCKHENTNTQCIYFDFTRHMKDIHTTDLIKDYKLIPLETRDSVIIGKIDKAILYKDRIYIAIFHREQAVIFLIYKQILTQDNKIRTRA